MIQRQRCSIGALNEKLDLGNFHNGIVASAALYREIGALGG